MISSKFRNAHVHRGQDTHIEGVSMSGREMENNILLDLIFCAVEGQIAHFNLPSLIAHRLKEVHNLILILCNLVKFLVLEFKVFEQPLSTLAKLHYL